VLYAILCYNSEQTVMSWTQEQDDAVMARLGAVHERVQGAGKLGPSVRLHSTAQAVTLRKHKEPHTVTDGPFAETKEQILGFYVMDVENQEEALQIARELGQANPGGSYELRPISLYLPGALANP